jgi:hypothetical protein
MSEFDTGLGLNEFLGSTPAPVDATDSAPVVETKTETETQVTPETPAETKTEEVKTSESVVSETPPATTEAKPSFDWESDDNPYKGKLQTTEKRRLDAEKWAQTEHQRALAVEKLYAELEKVHKKLDGNWTEADEQAATAAKPTPEMEAWHAETRGRTQASKIAAFEKYGEEKVAEFLTTFKEVYGNDPFVQQRVLASEMPVLEAINAVRGYKFFTEFGNDPDQIVSKIETKIRAELTEKIRAEEEGRRSYRTN